MAGTRKLEKFELEKLGVVDAEPRTESGTLPRVESGTQKMQKFVEPAFATARAQLTIRTPQAEISPLLMAEARASLTPQQIEEHSPLSGDGMIVSLLPAPIEEAEVVAEERVLDETTAPADEGARVSNAPRALDREPGVEQLRTRMARKFTTLADEVTEDFSEFSIGAGAWSVELTAPEGMSTGGGKRSMQHLRLKPKRQGHAILVGGVVDAVSQEADLRDYDHMMLVHRARFARDLEISPGEWEQFLRKAEVVLQKSKIETRRVPPPREVIAALEKTETALRKRKIATIAFAVICFLVALVAWRVVASLL